MSADPSSAVVAQSAALPPITAPNLRAQGVFDQPSLFDHAQRVALCLCASSMVPERFQGEKNAGNAMIAIDIAWRLQMPPLMVMQHLYVVYGTPSWSGQMVIALVNGSNLFNNPLDFEYRSERGKDDWGCRAFAVMKSTGEKVIGPWVDIAMAKAEGWYDRKDQKGAYCSKWRTIPELMMTYRAAAYFGRTRCPDILMGLRTREEEEDTIPAHGPLLETESRPSLGESAAQSRSQEMTPPNGASLGAAPSKRKKKEAAATATPPADPPPAAGSTPPVTEPVAPVAPPPPAAEPPATPPATAPAKPLAIQLAEWLATHGIPIDDFFDWIESAGWAQIYHFSVDTVESLEQLPEKMITDLLANEKVKAGIIRSFGTKK